MARKKRQRISYVLPLANSPGGHRLGVNGLAIDEEQSILYTGGRDGVICAWDLNLRLKGHENDNPFSSPDDPDSKADPKSKSKTKSIFRNQVQAHTHWVNDIVLANNNSALVSASSDVTVKVWRPHSEENNVAQTIGTHTDYVKCLATPGPNSDWVASGALDHKICLWDLDGGGERLQIPVGRDESVAKGSVYALSTQGSVLASGGPDSVVRLWDPKSGTSITKLVGHTDNVRDVLISEDGNTVLSASSDQTVKVWSLTAGRCMYTLTMHNDSVWSLYSNHPQLSLFYSGDRSGLIAKTDCREVVEMDEGISVAICQEHEGVNKVVAAGEHIWTSTANSGINRWKDVNTQAEIEEPPQGDEGSEGTGTTGSSMTSDSAAVDGGNDFKIPFHSVLRLSVTSPFPGLRNRDTELSKIHSDRSVQKPSDTMVAADIGVATPIRRLPEESIEGQHGLIKHVMLNDRKRVLTVDTAGEVILWDLLKCVPIKSYGKRHLDDVESEINTVETVANWCSVDTRTGKLAVMLEENYCFEAEVYADEITIDEKIDFRDDQRINLGKWVLRNLFTHLIDEEIRRDEDHRRQLLADVETKTGMKRENAPAAIDMPDSQNEFNGGVGGDSIQTPKANGLHPLTTGFSIGAASPGLSKLPTTSEEGAVEGKTQGQSQTSPSPARPNDYFSTTPSNKAPDTPIESSKAPVTPGETTVSPTDAEGEKKKSLFGKKFQMGFPKKLGRTSAEVKQAPAEDKIEGSDKSTEAEEKVFEDNLYGVIQRIRNDYDEQLANRDGQGLAGGITPSLPNETPVLKQPAQTQIIIQEDSPESGGVIDLYRGTISTQSQETNLIEKVAPMWLGDLLLRNQIPLKEPAKVSFILQPYQDLLPSIASIDGNSRLNANRMLRAKKILLYVAERIEPAPETPEPNPLKPEEYLELYCQGQLVPPHTTLATIRVHLWRMGGDVILYYKANGRKEIRTSKPSFEDLAPTPTSATDPQTTAVTPSVSTSSSSATPQTGPAAGNGSSAADSTTKRPSSMGLGVAGQAVEKEGISAVSAPAPALAASGAGAAVASSS